MKTKRGRRVAKTVQIKLNFLLRFGFPMYLESRQRSKIYLKILNRRMYNN